jgi:hypothetical protein
MVRCTGACLDPTQVSVFKWCWLRWFLAFLLHGIYRRRQECDTKINTIHKVQRVVCCMIMSNLTNLTSMSVSSMM